MNQRTCRIEQLLASRTQPAPLSVADAVGSNQHLVRRRQPARCLAGLREAARREHAQHLPVVDQFAVDGHRLWTWDLLDHRERVPHTKAHPHGVGPYDLHTILIDFAL